MMINDFLKKVKTEKKDDKRLDNISRLHKEDDL